MPSRSTQESQRSGSSLYKVAGGTLVCASMGAVAWWLGRPRVEESVAPVTEEKKQPSVTQKSLPQKPAAKSPAVIDFKVIQQLYNEAWKKVLTTGKIDPVTLSVFKRLDPEKQSIESRVLIAKFFTLYIQITNESSFKKPTRTTSERVLKVKDLEMCNKWLRYEIPDYLSDELIGETIYCRSRLAVLSRDFNRIAKVYEVAKRMRRPSTITKGPHTYLLQQLFQMSCMLGYWDAVTDYGKEVARFSEVRGKNNVNIMDKYHSDAMKAPNKQLNYKEIYMNVDNFKDAFDRNIGPVLKFSQLDVIEFDTKFKDYNTSLDDKPRTSPDNSSWVHMYEDLPIPRERRKIWVFGAGCQLFCPIAQLALPITGPLDDSQMKLTGSSPYQERSPQGGPPERMSMTLALNLEKTESKTIDNKKYWQWEGTLNVLMHKVTIVEDQETKNKLVRLNLKSDRTFEVRLTTT